MTNTTIKDLTQYLERIAPAAYQESYDNSGLIVGDPNTIISGVLICLDSTEAIVDEAIAKGANLIVAHHPIVFKGLKRFNGRNYVERVVMKAIKHDIAIYAIHTNLDSVLYEGVNTRIAEMLGLENTKILAPKAQILRQLVTFVPSENAENVRKALFGAGAGAIGNYDECSFNLIGFGTFRANDKAKPFIGDANVQHREAETRIEVVFQNHQQSAIMAALKLAHPYEEVAYYISQLENTQAEIGAGMIGTLPKPMAAAAFLKQLKSTMKAGVVRHTALGDKPISKVAVCGGAGGFLLNDAIAQGADLFVTADYKYHEFFDADGKIIIADIGHFESEQYTISLLFDVLSKKYSTFALYCTEVNTNPVHYI